MEINLNKLKKQILLKIKILIKQLNFAIFLKVL